MKALLFNHHPEHTWEIKRSLEAIGIDVFIASERLTFECGASYCSINSNLEWRRGPIWFDSKKLFEDNFKYSDTLENFDYVFTMNRDIANKISFDPNKLFFIAAVNWDLSGMNNFKKYTKISAHPLANKFGAKFLPRFVELKGQQKDKIFITQLIEGFQNSIFTKKLIELKNKNKNIIIAGSESAPDGVVMDWDILSQTSLLVHYKNYGIMCTCILKAFDCGIPVYTTKENRLQMGFTDMSDDCFLFADDMSIEDAFEKSQKIDNKKIQKEFRFKFNLNNTSIKMKELLNKGNI